MGYDLDLSELTELELEELAAEARRRYRRRPNELHRRVLVRVLLAAVSSAPQGGGNVRHRSG